MLDAAISVLPDADAAGHRAGDDTALGGREMVLRVDAGGCSARIAEACRDRNITFFMRFTDLALRSTRWAAWPDHQGARNS